MKSRVMCIKCIRNSRCKGGVLIKDINRFNHYLMYATVGTIAALVDDDGNTVKSFIKVINNNPTADCSDCPLGKAIAKRNHCRCLICYRHKIIEVESMLEDL